MEEKLYLRNRGDGDYFLESRTSNSASVVGSLNPTHFAEHKLSLKNCEAIANGYDLDELAEKRFGKSLHHAGNRCSFREGFQKALQILGDKKFSERDIKAAIRRGYVERQKDEGVGVYFESYEEFIQSLQQTEWDVEIVMESIGKVKLGPGSNTEQMMPKLNAENCLILKRK